MWNSQVKKVQPLYLFAWNGVPNVRMNTWNALSTGQIPASWQTTIFKILPKSSEMFIFLYKISVWFPAQCYPCSLAWKKPLKIIGSRQHGCTKGRMIKEHLLTANSFLHKTFAAKLSFWMISLDLSKALDRVDWEALCGTVLAFRLSTQIHFQICDISNVALYSPPPIWPNMVV